jgi:hypothetical protein
MGGHQLKRIKKETPGAPKKLEKKRVKYNMNIDFELKEKVEKEANKRGVRPNMIVMEALRYYFEPESKTKKRSISYKIYPFPQVTLKKLMKDIKTFEKAGVIDAISSTEIRGYLFNASEETEPYSQRIYLERFSESLDHYVGVDEIEKHMPFIIKLHELNGFLNQFEKDKGKTT